MAHKHQKTINKHKSSEQGQQLLKDAATMSLYIEEGKEIYDDFVYEKYDDMELSTQMIIREAENQKINVEVLDRKDNFLLLSSGRHSHYLKQATHSKLDDQISYFAMKNKLVMKRILSDQGIVIPAGDAYSNIEEAQKQYHNFADKKIVVKPQNTNYGIGINFVEKGDEKQFQAALQNAFSFDNSVIVEEFVEGREFRFLVVGAKVVSIVERIPANVVGDGKSTISELVEEKNWNPRNYKIEKYHIKLGKQEREYLSKQKLKTSSVLPKGKRILLKENSNVSTGGDPIDFTDKISKAYKKIAVQAAKAARATFCGVDMMIKNLNDKPNFKNHAIIEINYNPTLFIHEFTINGPRRNIAKPVLKALGF